MKNFKIFLIVILGLLIIFSVFVFLNFYKRDYKQDQIIQPTQDQINHSYLDFKNGLLDNLMILETKEENKMTLKITQIDFQKYIIADNFLSARAVHAVDINKDGKTDILGAARQIHQIAWWRNNGNQNFTKIIIDDNFRGAFSVHGVDLNNDGYKDIIGASLYGGQVAWWENNQDGTFSIRKIIDDQFKGAIYTYGADVDGDGYMDILAAGEAINQIAWWRNQKDETFSSRLVIEDNFKGARSVHAKDVDNDRDIDVLGTARFADEIAWWENDGNQKFTKIIIDDNFDGPRSVHAVDLDQDGDIDILGAARYAYQVVWWKNDGNQNFTKIIIDDQFAGATNLYAADINQDGKKDIIATAVFADKIAWWENQGNGNFIKFIIEKNFDGATFVYVKDINKDGYPDILVPAVFDNQIGLWINNPQHLSSGTFVSPIIDLRKNKKEVIAFETLTWKGVVPEDTSLHFQIRSADSEKNLKIAYWYGPFSREDYYTISKTDINPIHSGHFLLQYRVFFKTNNPLFSPSLNRVIINYRVFPEKNKKHHILNNPVFQRKEVLEIQDKNDLEFYLDIDSFALYEGYYDYLRAIPKEIKSSFIFRIDIDKKQVALTFDDGPIANTPALIEVLERHQAPATFFIICENLNFKNVKYYQSDFVKVGIHSYSHANFQNFSKDETRADINKCLSKFTKYNLSSRYFRPPFGIITENLIKVLEEKNLQGILWSIDSLDWKKYEDEKLFNQVIENLKNGSIILFHDWISVTVLEKIIVEIREKGFEIVFIEYMLRQKIY